MNLNSSAAYFALVAAAVFTFGPVYAIDFFAVVEAGKLIFA